MLIIRFLTTEISVRQMRSLGIINNELKKHVLYTSHSYSTINPVHSGNAIEVNECATTLQYLDHTLRA
jgi:hypothetical protein